MAMWLFQNLHYKFKCKINVTLSICYFSFFFVFIRVRVCPIILQGHFVCIQCSTYTISWQTSKVVTFTIYSLSFSHFFLLPFFVLYHNCWIQVFASVHHAKWPLKNSSNASQPSATSPLLQTIFLHNHFLFILLFSSITNSLFIYFFIHFWRLDFSTLYIYLFILYFFVILLLYLQNECIYILFSDAV